MGRGGGVFLNKIVWTGRCKKIQDRSQEENKARNLTAEAEKERWKDGVVVGIYVMLHFYSLYNAGLKHSLKVYTLKKI